MLLSAFSGLPDVLESFHVPIVPLLRDYGLTPADLREPDRTGSFRDMSRLLDECARVTTCSHFGLLLGRRINLRSLGLAGRLAENSPTVDEALGSLVTYFALHDSGAELDVVVERDAVTFSYTIGAADVVAPQHVYDLAIGAMATVMRDLCGAGWRPTLVMLPRRPPPKLEPYRATLGTSLRFDQVKAALVFPSLWLSRPVRGADPILYRLLLREVRARAQQANPLICRDVRRAIIGQLHAGHCSRRDVANLMGMHERTLCRHLRSSGTTFQHALDEVRSELAQQFLRDTDMPVSQIARELGFRTSTVMARAFRRWSGMSPREYRNGRMQAR